MMRRIEVPVWPATEWVQIGLPRRGAFRWVTYLRGPTSFVWIRRAGAAEWFRLVLGHSFPIDPACDYEILNRGFASDGCLTVSNLTCVRDTTDLANAAPTGDPWRTIAGETVIVATPERLTQRGSLRARFRVTSAVATVTANPFRLSTLGLRRVAIHLYNIGPDTITLYADTFDSDTSLAYALATMHFLNLALTIAAGTIGYANLAEQQGGTSALTATSNGLPIREMLAPLLAITFTGGSVSIVEVSGVT